MPLSLQAVFERAYNAGPYRRALSYGEETIVPPLRAEQLAWRKGASSRRREGRRRIKSR